MAAGTIEQLPSGAWRLSVMIDGKRHRRTVKGTRRDAERARAELILEAGGVDPDHMPTIGELIEDRLRRWQGSATSLNGYRSIEARIPRQWLELPANELGPRQLENLYRTLERAGWTPSVLEKVGTLLGPALERAEALGIIPASPARTVKAPKAIVVEIAPPPPSVVAELLEAATGWFSVFLRLAVTTGARRGELCALTWEAIDLEARRLTIRTAAIYTPQSGVTIKAPKSARGRRTISLDAGTVEALRGWRAERNELGLALGTGAPRFVFGRLDEDGPLRPDTATQAFGRLCARVGSPDTRLHDLRHYHATQALAAGVPVSTVAARLGHDPAVCLRVYGHFIPGSDEAAADLVASTISPQMGRLRDLPIQTVARL